LAVAPVVLAADALRFFDGFPMNTGQIPAKPHLPGPSEPFDISLTEDALAALTHAYAGYGDAFRIFSPAVNAHICVFSHPDHVRRVFVDNHANYTKGIGIERVRILLGNGIMASEGDVWRRQRKLIQPAFHRDVISRMLADIRDANLQLRDQWLEQAQRGAEIDLTQNLSDVTLKIVLKAIFGADMKAIESTAGGNPFMLLTQDTERNLQFAYKFRALSKLVMDCVNQRRRGAPGDDLLGMLVTGRDRKSNDPMTDRQLVDEVLTLVVAGHETTASALNWLWYLLARHPRIEQRMHAEIDAWDQNNADVNSFLQLTYTRQVIDETMRLYPPGWLLTRRSINADVIGGHPIAPNTDVFISPYLVHRHPAFWENPDQFDPDRFEASAKAQRNRFCYLPFALGPRACIGEHFAMVEMMVHTVLIARKLRLRYLREEPVEMECHVNLRPKQSIMMRLEERN
jgi:cytochrome P450